MSRNPLQILVRNFVVELIIYGALVIGYLVVVLKTLREWLTALAQGNLFTYALIALILVVAQAVVLDFITTFLLDRIELERLE